MLNKNASSQALDQRIGILSDGRCYAFVNGYDQPETIGTRVEIERALGLVPPPPERKALRRYAVTVTPLVVVYTGRHAGGEYVVEVIATKASEAIKKVRQQRREEEGQHAVTAIFRARLVR